MVVGPAMGNTPWCAMMGKKEEHNRDMDEKKKGDNDILCFLVGIIWIINTSFTSAENVTV